MTATREDITGWLAEGQKRGARWVIIGLDRFDYENYPIYVMPGEDFYKRFDRIGDNGDGDLGDSYDEVYDLTLDIEDQMKEWRAKHLPPRPVGRA